MARSNLIIKWLAFVTILAQITIWTCDSVAVAALIPSFITAGATLAASAMSTGLSILAAQMSVAGYSVSMTMDIKNYCDEALTESKVFINSGQIANPAGDIQPSIKESFATTKMGNSATGTSGTVSWKFKNGQRMIIMWSVPYSHDFYSNWLAIGAHKQHDSEDFRRMYHDSDADWFDRKEYYYDSESFAFEAEDHYIVGTMSTNHKAKVEISVYPKTCEHMAPKFKEKCIEKRDSA